MFCELFGRAGVGFAPALLVMTMTGYRTSLTLGKSPTDRTSRIKSVVARPYPLQSEKTVHRLVKNTCQEPRDPRWNFIAAIAIGVVYCFS